MGRIVCLLGVLLFPMISSATHAGSEIPEAGHVTTWSAPPFWAPPQAARLSSGARTTATSPLSTPLPFIALTPCRVADTRGNGFSGQYGPPGLEANTIRDFTISGQCGIPASAAAVSFNFAALNVGATGNLRVFPAGGGAPLVSTLNYDAGTPNIANAAVVSLGTGGAITVQADATGIDLIIDVNGYYDGGGALQLSMSRRAILGQFWTSQNASVISLTPVGEKPELLRSDGADLWVASYIGNSVSRVRASDGKLLETWTGAASAFGVLVAAGRVFITGGTSPGNLYQIDPSQVPGAVTTVASNLGGQPAGVAFDGARIWAANFGGSVSIITPGNSPPWVVTTVTTGFSKPLGALYDGTNVWVTDFDAGALLKLDGSGAILQTVAVGAGPSFPVFDGMNIWVPNENSNSVSVVRVSSAALQATLSGNGLNLPISAAFDGQRLLVTNFDGSVSLWRAADLTPLGSFRIAPGNTSLPVGACSDGIDFWIALSGANKLARF